MPDYRRLYVSGGTYFFTVALADRRSHLLVEHIDHLRAAWLFAAQKHPFRTVAYVVLPDHLHCIWRLPEGDRDFSTRWKVLKARYSRSLSPSLDIVAGRRVGERGVWQRRFWEHLIRDDADFDNHLAYIHNNPVKHGYVVHRDEWRWSSWHRLKSQMSWLGDRAVVPDTYFGEG